MSPEPRPGAQPHSDRRLRSLPLSRTAKITVWTSNPPSSTGANQFPASTTHRRSAGDPIVAVCGPVNVTSKMSCVVSFRTLIVWPNDPASIALATVFTCTDPGLASPSHTARPLPAARIPPAGRSSPFPVADPRGLLPHNLVLVQHRRIRQLINQHPPLGHIFIAQHLLCMIPAGSKPADSAMPGLRVHVTAFLPRHPSESRHPSSPRPDPAPAGSELKSKIRLEQVQQVRILRIETHLAIVSTGNFKRCERSIIKRSRSV